MRQSPHDQTHTMLERVMRNDRGRLLASLATRLNSLPLAEDCLQEAISTALKHWAAKGIPDNPQGWLLRVSHRRAIDILRRSKNFANKSDDIALLENERLELDESADEIPDQRLRLIFTCCHPALSTPAQVALTLHTIGGLSTSEIARAFLVQPTTMGQRLSRAKNKIKKAGIPYKLPENTDIPERINSVLQVVYLIYNEGYSATHGSHQIRIDLCEEALFLTRLIITLIPDQTEASGLLALILFSHARRNARNTKSGAYVPLDQQDRTLWDSAMIDEGREILSTVLPKGQLGPYQIQAAIHGLHCNVDNSNETDWPQIAGLYGLLVQMVPTAVTKLNYAVAKSFSGKPKQALKMLDQVEYELSEYQPYHCARADTLQRLDKYIDACAAYSRAISMTQVQGEIDFLQGQLKICSEKMQ